MSSHWRGSIAGICICAIALGSGCGGGSSEPASPPPKRQDGKAQATRQIPTGAEIAGSPVKPRLHIPPGPPPKQLVVRVLRRGSGPGAQWGQRLTVQHVGVNYRTGEEFEDRWGKKGPFTFTLGIEEVRKGWDIGLKGMKVGGRRELFLPSRLGYGTGPLAYVVELLGITWEGGNTELRERAARGAAGGKGLRNAAS
jgi:hypothetical protein